MKIAHLIVVATEETLNQAVLEHGITPETLISVSYEPRQPMAMGDFEAKYHVLFWVKE